MPDTALPLTAMQQAATALHELFRTLVTVGFSEAQALQLLGALMERTANAQD